MHHPSLRNRHLPTRILSAQYHPTEASPAPLSPSEHMQIDSSDDPDLAHQKLFTPCYRKSQRKHTEEKPGAMRMFAMQQRFFSYIRARTRATVMDAGTGEVEAEEVRARAAVVDPGTGEAEVPAAACADAPAAAPPAPVSEREPLLYFEDEPGPQAQERRGLRLSLSRARRTNKQRRERAGLVMRAPNLILDEATMPLDDLRDELQQIIDHNVGLERRAEARSRGKQAQVAAQVTAQDAARDTDVELKRRAEARSGNQAQAAAQVTAQEAARVAAWEAATDAWWNDIVGMGAYCLISLILGLAARDHPLVIIFCIFCIFFFKVFSWVKGVDPLTWFFCSCCGAFENNEMLERRAILAQDAARDAAPHAAPPRCGENLVGMIRGHRWPFLYCLISFILGLAARDHPDFRFACIFLCFTIEFVAWFIYGCCFCGCLRRPDQRPD